MTNAQRVILKVGLIVALVAGLFPPWQLDMGLAGGDLSGIIGKGHHFILGRRGLLRIDYSGLFMTWVIIALMTGTVLAFTSGSLKRNADSSS